VSDVPCRYCGNVIHVEHRKPPPNVHPFGQPGGMPSTTLYLDPDAMRAMSQAGKHVGLIIALTTLLPLFIGIVAGLGSWGLRAFKGSVRPFPAVCELNESIELSGNYEGTGPLVNAGINCKIKIKNAKLKGSTLLEGSAANVEVTLENVTIETTDVLYHGGSNGKLRVKGGKLTSTSSVIDADSNAYVNLDGTTIESKDETAIKVKYNLKLEANNAKILGKAGAIETDSNAEITMKGTSEISSPAIALKATSNLKLDAVGGKVEGGESAIVADSSAHIKAKGTVFTAKEKTIVLGSSADIDLSEGSVTSTSDSAFDIYGTGEYEFIGTTVQGTDAAINAKNGFKLRASKKARLVATQGNGVQSTTNFEFTLVDASVEGARAGVKAGVNTKGKLSQGAKVSGKRGGILADGNMEIEAKDSAVEGGAGPGLQGTSNARIAFSKGTLRGAPAIELKYRPSSLELEGTKVEGEQHVGR
jgi:hypothetical protein